MVTLELTSFSIVLTCLFPSHWVHPTKRNCQALPDLWLLHLVKTLFYFVIKYEKKLSKWLAFIFLRLILILDRIHCPSCTSETFVFSDCLSGFTWCTTTPVTWRRHRVPKVLSYCLYNSGLMVQHYDIIISPAAHGGRSLPMGWKYTCNILVQMYMEAHISHRAIARTVELMVFIYYIYMYFSQCTHPIPWALPRPP